MLQIKFIQKSILRYNSSLSYAPFRLQQIFRCSECDFNEKKSKFVSIVTSKLHSSYQMTNEVSMISFLEILSPYMVQIIKLGLITVSNIHCFASRSFGV